MGRLEAFLRLLRVSPVSHQAWLREVTGQDLHRLEPATFRMLQTGDPATSESEVGSTIYVAIPPLPSEPEGRAAIRYGSRFEIRLGEWGHRGSRKGSWREIGRLLDEVAEAQVLSAAERAVVEDFLASIRTDHVGRRRAHRGNAAPPAASATSPEPLLSTALTVGIAALAADVVTRAGVPGLAEDRLLLGLILLAFTGSVAVLTALILRKPWKARGLALLAGALVALEGWWPASKPVAHTRWIAGALCVGASAVVVVTASPPAQDVDLSGTWYIGRFKVADNNGFNRHTASWGKESWSLTAAKPCIGQLCAYNVSILDADPPRAFTLWPTSGSSLEGTDSHIDDCNESAPPYRVVTRNGALEVDSYTLTVTKAGAHGSQSLIVSMHGTATRLPSVPGSACSKMSTVAVQPLEMRRSAPTP